MTIWPTVSATGHRSQHLSPTVAEWIRPELDRVAAKLRDEYGTRVGISGMATGVDQWWARSVLRAGLELWAYVPFPQQPDVWDDEDRAEWADLLRQATRVRYFGDLADVANSANRRRKAVMLLHARNGGMLEDADAVVAVHRPSKADGGTANAVKKAKRLGLPIVHVDPDARTVRLLPVDVIGGAA